MIRSFLICFLIFAASSAFGADLKVFADPRTAIAAAKGEGKHIVFLLWDSKNKDHVKIAQELKLDLEKLKSEFVIANCSHSLKSNLDLFSGRFGKELTKMPIAVVSNAQGEEITSYQGTKDEGYEKMVITARIEGGKVTDPVTLANLKENLEKVGQKKGLLAPMVEDLNVRKVAITKMRDWTKKDGSVFKAILLEALGSDGVFVDDKGNSTKVNFMDLSPENLEFLETVLRIEKSE